MSQRKFVFWEDDEPVEACKRTPSPSYEYVVVVDPSRVLRARAPGGSEADRLDAVVGVVGEGLCLCERARPDDARGIADTVEGRSEARQGGRAAASRGLDESAGAVV